MRTPTPDQRAVVKNAARVRLVRAAPGSGKTWMVAEVIGTELAHWSFPYAGLAALSFTRVGGEEIRSALGRDLAHPHFVNTIDAFLFRYIVRPHIRRIDRKVKGVELIPPDWAPGVIWSGRNLRKGLNPYACVWTGRDSRGNPVLSQQLRFGEWQQLDEEDQQAVVELKQEERRVRGRITISDSTMLASELLRHAVHGPLVRAEVVRRFPLLIVDELQDTSGFQAESLRHLVADESTRALLVGDPDQAIYEFTGARPKMFETFAELPGAETLSLSTSLRCPPAAARVASALSKGRLNPAEEREGSAYLVRYDDMTTDVPVIARAMEGRRPNAVVKVVTRLNATVDDLTGRGRAPVPSLHCRPATLLHRGVQYFRRRRTITALAAARAAIEQMLMGGEGFTDAEAVANGVDPQELRSLAIACLLAANALHVDVTVHEWQQAALGVLERECGAYCERRGRAPRLVKAKPARRKGHDAPVAKSIAETCLAGPQFGSVPVVTVHAVKGETHAATVFVVPPTVRKAAAKRCPSLTWWSNDDANDEERRIAYVALTRSRGDVVLCVDGPAYARLAAAQPEFVGAFECCTVANFIGRLEGAGAVTGVVPALA